MKGREMIQNDILWAESMLGRINRSAKTLFRAAVSEGNIEKAYIYEYEENRGIVSVIRGENYLGFIRDDLGFEFVLNKQEDMLNSCMTTENSSEITVKAYEEEHFQEYLCLLDDAFPQQNEECGLERDVYKNAYANYQNNKMKHANESGDFLAFWLNEKLLGLCLFRKEYLDTIAVAPEFEGKGYGSKIMEICIRDRWLVKNYSEIYLHTYMQNRRAQRLYMKYGFELQGFYSENSFAEGGTNV